ncbi:MATE family efflux transporter [Halegenticoccus tardaugens]|uniref:MATE family efflux transporter n=1 Tax=Halegenticoccus tardaugens TaxID=2071624 RepID=UPI00100B115C|nr:MATE family efflux transporter [Halegenticoccus tardaugens]
MLDLSKEDITEGPIPRALLLLAAPLLVQNVTQVIQQIVDIFWLGRMTGTADPVAAVGLNYPIVSVFLMLAVFAPFVGTQVLVAQRVGGDDPAGARSVAFHGATMGLAFGVVVAAVAAAGAGPIVRAVGAGPAIAGMATAYLATYALVLPFAAVSDAVEGAFVGWGDSRAALYVTVTAVGVNVVLDPILIFGYGLIPPLGVRGAALATVLGTATGMSLAVAMAVGPRGSLSLSPADVGFETRTYREILDVGAPLVGQRLAQDGVRVLIVGIVASVGGAAGLAAYTIGARVASVAFIPATGLQQAAQSIVGQNLGAEKPARAGQTTWVGAGIAAAALSVVGAVQWLFPGTIAQLFVPEIGPDALSLTISYLQILAYGYWAIGASYLFLAGFNGASRTRTSMAVSLVQYWGVRLPVAAVGAYALDMGVAAVFWAVTLSNVAAALGAGAYYYYTTQAGMLERAAERAAGAVSD